MRVVCARCAVHYEGGTRCVYSSVMGHCPRCSVIMFGVYKTVMEDHYRDQVMNRAEPMRPMPSEVHEIALFFDRNYDWAWERTHSPVGIDVGPDYLTAMYAVQELDRLFALWWDSWETRRRPV